MLPIKAKTCQFVTSPTRKANAIPQEIINWKEIGSGYIISDEFCKSSQFIKLRLKNILLKLT